MSGQSLAEPALNATPLIDVLLVLLVMLIFTLPVATHAVKINVPQGRSAPPAPVVELAVDFDGQLAWNGSALSGLEEVEARFREVAASAPRTRIKVMPDRRAAYDRVAKVLTAAQRSRITRLEVAGIER